MSIYFDDFKAKAGKGLRKLMWVVLAGLLLFSGGYYFYRTYTKSEGTRTGTLFKISQKGYMFKTYEGQLLLAGSALMTDESTWNFSAKNAAVYQQLQQFEGKMVKCYYEEKVDAFPWQGDTDYIVTGAEAVAE